MTWPYTFSPTNLAAREFWIKFQAVWQLPVVTATFCFSLEYANPGHWLTRRNQLLPAIPIPVDFVLVLTNDLHHWLRFNTA